MLVRKQTVLAIAALGILTAQPAFAARGSRILWGTATDPATTASASATAPAAKTAPVQALPAPIAPSSANVDTSALIYYMQQHDQIRVEAEIRRLRVLNPGWEPPADLSSLASAPSDEQPLWDLYGADRLDELRTEIARRSAHDQGWRPSEELLTKLRLREVRRQLIACSDRQDWRCVIDLATQTTAIVDPADLESTWRIAQAHGRSGNPRRAAEIYQLILASETRAPERLATVQKASSVLDGTDLAGLVALGRTTANGTREFDSVRLDIARRHLGSFLTDKAAGSPAEEDLSALSISAAHSLEDANLLGWVRARQENWSDAEHWFRLALNVGQNPKSALGEAIALDHLGRKEDARRLAEDWRDRDETIADLFVDQVSAQLTGKPTAEIPASRLAAFATMVRSRQIASGAAALGWYAYDSRQYEAAAAWFERAMDWKPDAKCAEGQILSLQHLPNKAKLKETLTQYAALYPDVVKGLTQPATHAARSQTASAKPSANGDGAAACSALLQQPAGKSSLAAKTRLQQGWCYLNAQRPQEAAAAFETLGGEQGTLGSEAAYGLSIARLRSGETARAVAAATVLSPEKRNEIGAVALAQQAISAFDQGRYEEVNAILTRRRAFADPTRDLEMLRAWALLKSGQKSAALNLFASLDVAMSTRETRGGINEASKTANGR